MVAILQFLGTNCERDCAYVCEVLERECAIVWHKERELPRETHLVIIPGGFSYGDYLRSGAIARFSPIMAAVARFAQNGGLVFGICNGFQILCEAGLLPGALMRNKNLRFISKPVNLEVASTKNRLLQGYKPSQTIRLPIAHADGNYYAGSAVLEKLRENDQILLRYTEDVNGSVGGIAGVCNETKNVFGMMPHPERACEGFFGGSADGLAMMRDICG